MNDWIEEVLVHKMRAASLQEIEKLLSQSKMKSLNIYFNDILHRPDNLRKQDWELDKFFWRVERIHFYSVVTKTHETSMFVIMDSTQFIL